MDIEQIFREEQSRILATLIGLLGSFDLAEEVTQEASPLPFSNGPCKEFQKTRKDGWSPPRGIKPSTLFAATQGSKPNAKSCNKRTRWMKPNRC